MLEHWPQPGCQRWAVTRQPEQAQCYRERHPPDVVAAVGQRVRQSEPVEAGNSLALAGDTLFVGSAGRVRAFNAHSGRKLWSEAVPGRALGLAVANGALLVSTDTGAIISFGQADDQPSAWILF